MTTGSSRRDHVTELEQFTADTDAVPPRVVLRHLQNQLLDFGIETWPTRTTPPTEGCPPSPHQLAMPTQNRLRLDQHPDQSRTAHPLAQRRHHRPIRRIQLRPLDLSAHDTKLVPEEKQFRLRIVDSQPHIEQIEEQSKPGSTRDQKASAVEILIGQATLLRVARSPINM